MQRRKPRFWNIAGAIICVMAAIVAPAWLSDWLLRAPGGVPLFFIAAPFCMMAGFFVAMLAWDAGRPPPNMPATWAVRLAIYAVFVPLSFLAVFPIALAGESVRNQLYHSDPIGVGDDVARGPCTSQTVATVPNGRGLVASVRKTECEGNWDGDAMYFVFVHPTSAPNTRETLVCRYAVDVEPDVTAPSVHWNAPNRLRISGIRYVLPATIYRRAELLGTTIDVR